MERSIALFGAAEKGSLSTLYECHEVEELFWLFGQPPQDSEGIYHAIQIILKGFTLIYHRVREEGVSKMDYLLGFKLLQELPEKAPQVPKLGALFLPKMGISDVIEEGVQICHHHHGLLIMKEADLYDFLTSRS